ncbi:MAG: tRNA pseudouridine(55) synthase TruB [Buchananella hordeovulneris]|nr:tRNA pseudouridine(55) synthase TruB [Buchananella hordeovulneris]
MSREPGRADQVPADQPLHENARAEQATEEAQVDKGQPGPGQRRGQLRGPSVARGAVPSRSGCIVIDKPAGLTSHDVVGKVRRLAATKKVGHAGTLDPMATGVLVVGIGAATRLLTHITGTDKEYLASIRLGVGTTTDDADGEVLSTPGCAALDPQHLAAAMANLTGQIMQVPATVSAIKVDGVRSYARVRAGEDVELAARPVEVPVFELTAAPEPKTVVVGLPATPPGEDEDRAAGGNVGHLQESLEVVDLHVRVVCSAGTYIRALARDLGQALGSAGHLTMLRRTRVGSFTAAQAVSLEQASAQVEADAAGQAPSGLAVVPLTEVVAAEFRVRTVDEEQAQALRRGMFLPAQPGQAPGAAIGPDGAVALLRRQGNYDRPYVVFPANIEG